MKPINSQCQMVKFGEFVEKLTATQSMPSIIWNVKCVTKKSHMLEKKRRQYEGI